LTPDDPQRLAYLCALAQRCAQSLVRREHCAVALTGSTARGDATIGSDVDLWVIGRASGRQHLRVDGTRVTLLRYTLPQALAVDTLCRFEVDDVQVLADPHGVFQQIRRRFDQRRSVIRSLVLADTEAALLEELAAAADGAPLQRVLALRQAALRLAKVEVYFVHGWRVPKWRNIVTALPRPLVARLRTLLALAPTPAARQLDHALPALLSALSRARCPRPDPTAIEVARQRLVGGAVEDALVALQQLTAQVPTHWLVCQPPLTEPKRTWLELHGLRNDERGQAAALAQAQRRFVAFVQALPSLRWWQKRLPLQRVLDEVGCRLH